MRPVTALEGGLAGSIILTSIHELIKRTNPKAPRMDLLGMNALSKLLQKTFDKNPDPKTLFIWTLAGDIIANSLYYSLTGTGKSKTALVKGTLLGLAAGAGAILLPKPLGLNQAYSTRTTTTKLLTVVLYLTGGLIAAATVKLLEKRQ